MFTQKIEVAPLSSNAWVDLTPFLVPGGFTWSRIDIDLTGPTLQSGVTPVVRIREKYGATLNFRKLDDGNLKTVLEKLMPKKIQLRFYSPETGAQVTKTVVTGNIQVPFFVQTNSAAYHMEFSVTLEEY